MGGGSIVAGWVKESFAYEKPEIPNCTAINSTVGAGDAFLGGLLVGLEILVSKNVDVPSDFTLGALLKFAQSTAVSQIYGSQMNRRSMLIECEMKYKITVDRIHIN